MKLTKLLSGITYEVLEGDTNKEVLNIADNSKSCTKDCVFFAISGTKVDGNSYISEALELGASVIITDREISVACTATIVKVESVRKALAKAAFNFYLPNGYAFKVIGITGTNGKTTTSFMIGETLKNAGFTVCVVGTSGIFVNSVELRGESLTTPDSIDIANLFAFLNEIKVDYVVMEVSAHALQLNKTSAINFDYGIFTNLTEDHLDFFKNMDVYGRAKSKLFKNSKISIINIDDKFGKELLDEASGEVVTYGTHLSANYILKENGNNSFKLKYNNTSLKVSLNMPGVYNFYNATGAIIVLLREGINKNRIKNSLKKLPLISGRYNIFKTKTHGEIVLDFAHTPDGLEKVLCAARENAKKDSKVISVFGCGGNRDKDKRGIMGAVSGKMADYTFISIDNPRFEDENIVMADIERGIKPITNNYEIVMPRSRAIEKAIEMSAPGDVVVISGKGTEPYYEVMGKKHYYREDIVIKCIIKNLEKN